MCAIEAAAGPITRGVTVDVNGKLGHSPPHVQFTYQVSAWLLTIEGRLWTRGGVVRPPPGPDPRRLPLFQQPQPLSVDPKQGPQAGGTTLTISGTHLDTGSEEDVRVTLNDVPCKVWVSSAGC